MALVHTSAEYFFQIHFNIIISSILASQKIFVPSAFPTQVLCALFLFLLLPNLIFVWNLKLILLHTKRTVGLS